MSALFGVEQPGNYEFRWGVSSFVSLDRPLHPPIAMCLVALSKQPTQQLREYWCWEAHCRSHAFDVHVVTERINALTHSWMPAMELLWPSMELSAYRKMATCGGVTTGILHMYCLKRTREWDSRPLILVEPCPYLTISHRSWVALDHLTAFFVFFLTRRQAWRAASHSHIRVPFFRF